MYDQTTSGQREHFSRRSFLLTSGLAAAGVVSALLRLRENWFLQSQQPLEPLNLVAINTVANQIHAMANPTATASVAEVPLAPTAQAPGLSLNRPLLIPHDSWALPARTSGFEAHTLQRITLHHEGVFFDGTKGSVKEYLRRVQIWGMRDRGWEDLPYHLLIDLTGTTYEGRPLWAKGDTNTSYNLTGHALIALVGDYDMQQPNQAQLDSIAAWMAWLVQEYKIPLTEIRGHKDYIPRNAKGEHIDGHIKITCPGDNLYVYLQNGYFLREVCRLLGLTADAS